jgi:hypothetical protein
MSRREFVTVIATGAGLAAAAPALADRNRRRRSSTASKSATTTTPPPTAATTDARQAEFERQREGMRSLVKLVRETPLPPGGDLALVFQPLRAARKGR